MIGAKELRKALLGYEKRKMEKEQLFLDKKAQVADKLKSFIPAIAKAFSVPKSKFIVRFDGKIPSINTTESGDANLGLGSCFVNLQMYSEDIITAFVKYGDLQIHMCQVVFEDPKEAEEIVSQYMLTDDFLRGVYRILKNNSGQVYRIDNEHEFRCSRCGTIVEAIYGGPPDEIDLDGDLCGECYSELAEIHDQVSKDATAPKNAPRRWYPSQLAQAQYCSPGEGGRLCYISDKHHNE